MSVSNRSVFLLPLLLMLLCSNVGFGQASDAGVFDQKNLVAWCIVPFDAKQRGPAARARMLQQLGIKRVAYDWRAQHVPTFEEEIQQYKKHDLEYFAFWNWHDSMESLIRKYDIHPQIWIMLPSPNADAQEASVKAAAEAIRPMVDKTKSLNCRLGLYNHGGWGGEPQNMVAVCEYLREHAGADHVGIVYNFHHGHEHIDDFSHLWNAMKPYLICLNINGMDDASTVASGKNKILPVGSGKHEVGMLKIVKASGYNGPVGILDHRSEMDAQESLRLNLQGLKKLQNQGL